MAPFFGIILIVLGVSIFFKIPLFSWIFGALLIYGGITVLTSTWKSSTIHQETYAHGTSFSSKTDIHFKNHFGQQTITIAEIVDRNNYYTIRSSTKFGETVIHLDPTIKTRVVATTSFAHLSTPKESISFGKTVYKNYTDNESPQVTIKAKIVFGSLRIYEF